VTRTLAFVVAVAAGAAFSWWEGGLRQFETAGHVGVLATVALAFVALALAGRGRQAQPSLAWARGPFALRRHLARDRAASLGAAVWTVLVLAVIGWDLVCFARQSPTVPTLSTIVGHVTSSQPGRAALFACWLALGTALAVGWRRR
jgi:hypothetical protein